MTKDETLDLALEALVLYQAAGFGNSTDFNKQHEAFYKAQTAIIAIKQARSAPAQEPLAWIDMREWPPIRWRDGMLRKDVDQFDGQGLYITPPAAQPAPVQEPDWKAEYLKSVESGCITLDELREANAELDATNRQVEILSDALAESRREVAALKAVQEPVALVIDGVLVKSSLPEKYTGPLYTTPPAAQRQWVGLKPGEAEAFYNQFAKYQQEGPVLSGWFQFTKAIEAKLKELNT